MAAYDRLYYNRVSLVYDGSQIQIAPNFRCPVCNGRPEALLNQTWNCTVNRALDVNGPIIYTMPCCQTQISLYIAVYKEKGSMSIARTISRLPIPSDWWTVM